MILSDMRKIRGKIKFYILALIFIFSCSSKETKVEHYSSGDIKSETEFDRGVQDGERVDYYKDGTIKAKSLWEDGKQHGITIFNYPSGALESKSKWVNGELNGYYEHYFENGKLKGYGYNKRGVKDGEYKLFYPNTRVLQEGEYKHGMKYGEQRVYYENGNLQSIQHFLNIKGQETVVSYVIYNEEGIVQEETASVEVAAKADTIAFGDSLEVSIYVQNPYFDSTRFIIGTNGFDMEFNIINPANIDTIFAKKHQVVFMVLPKEKGPHFLRGYADNFKVTETSGDTITTINSHLYFEYPFFVKD